MRYQLESPWSLGLDPLYNSGDARCTSFSVLYGKGLFSLDVLSVNETDADLDLL